MSLGIAKSQLLKCPKLETVRTKRVNDLLGRARNRFNLIRGAPVTETDAPASRIGFRMEIAHENIGSRFCHASHFAHHGAQIQDMPQGKRTDCQIKNSRAKWQVRAARSDKAPADRVFFCGDAEHLNRAINSHPPSAGPSRELFKPAARAAS